MLKKGYNSLQKIYLLYFRGNDALSRGSVQVYLRAHWFLYIKSKNLFAPAFLYENPRISKQYSKTCLRKHRNIFF